jgi:hypothetical protein
MKASKYKQVDFVDSVIDKRIYNGGSRVGAGRPKGISTKAIRVPVDLLPQILLLVDEYYKNKKV